MNTFFVLYATFRTKLPSQEEYQIISTIKLTLTPFGNLFTHIPWRATNLSIFCVALAGMVSIKRKINVEI